MAVPLKDPTRTFSFNGRPMRKPRRIAMRLASISSRSDLGDFYVMERPQVRSWRHMSLRECIESRPPMKPDLEGPTPCTYSVKLPPPKVLGGKINPRTKYSRDALPAPNTEIWTHNVGIAEMSPTPCTYTTPKLFGTHCANKQTAPAFTMATRYTPLVNKPGVNKEPSPSSYNSAKASEFTLRHFPSFTIGYRRDRSKSCLTPGPAHYHPNHSYSRYRSPSYSMRCRTATV